MKANHNLDNLFDQKRDTRQANMQKTYLSTGQSTFGDKINPKFLKDLLNDLHLMQQ